MQLKKKPTALVVAAGALVWELFLQPLWNLLLEHWADRGGFGLIVAQWGEASTAVWSFGRYVPGSFGIGFAVGGLLFAYWDTVALAFRRIVLQKSTHVSPATSNDKLKAWVGEISVTIKWATQHKAEIYMEIINWGSEPCRLGNVDGFISFNSTEPDGVRSNKRLPRPTVVSGKGDDKFVDAGRLLFLILEQEFPREVQRIIPDALSRDRPRTYLELENLEIGLEGASGTTKLLKLPDCLRISAGEWTIRTNKAHKLWNTEEEKKSFRDGLNALSGLSKQLDG